jgi:Protein of unknown function (DUF4232)
MFPAVSSLFRSRSRALAVACAATAALVLAVTVATSASAAAKVSCKGISFHVLHNDQSGGVTLPAGQYTVSSPNLGCTGPGSASGYFTTFLNKYNHAIPGWKGKAIAKGWGTYTKNNSKTQFTVKWSKAKGGAGSAPGSACATSALKVSLGRANGTAGTVFYPLKFVNKSKTSCTLRGYPGVSAVTKSGKQIGKPARRSGGKFRTVTLAPGKQQSSSVGIVDTGNFSAARCKPVNAFGLKVFPPNQGTAVILKKKFSTCSSKASVSLQVRPVK